MKKTLALAFAMAALSVSGQAVSGKVASRKAIYVETASNDFAVIQAEERDGHDGRRIEVCYKYNDKIRILNIPLIEGTDFYNKLKEIDAKKEYSNKIYRNTPHVNNVKIEDSKHMRYAIRQHELDCEKLDMVKDYIITNHLYGRAIPLPPMPPLPPGFPIAKNPNDRR